MVIHRVVLTDVYKAVVGNVVHLSVLARPFSKPSASFQNLSWDWC